MSGFKKYGQTLEAGFPIYFVPKLLSLTKYATRGQVSSGGGTKISRF
jgi:hypothetical protein